MKKNIQAFLLVSILAGASVVGTLPVEAAANSPYINGYSEGYFKKHEHNNIVFEEFDGTVHHIAFDGRTRLTIDEREVTIDDFKDGMEIYVELKGRKIVYMDGFSTDFPAYITPESKQRTGLVKKIDRDQIVITTAIGTEEIYFTSPSTIALQNGKNVSLNNLYVGDRVKLHFDDIDTTIVSKIAIDGSSVLIKDLYKGEISVTNRMSSVVTFHDVEVFRNGEWQEVGTLRLPYNSSLPLYVAGQKINYTNIENYKGKTAYIALKDFYGRDGAEKMVIKDQYETRYSEKIENINRYTSQIKLEGVGNIDYNEGTMVIKNGRLVDNYSITQNSSALVVTDGRGKNSTADVIYIYDEDINNSNIGMDRIYAGRIESMDQYKVNLRDFFVLDKNKWESFAYGSDEDIKGLYFDNETFIYDLEEDKTLTAKEMFEGEYHVDEDDENRKDKTKRDYNAYIYTDGDRISAIYLREDMDSLLRQRILNATVSSVDETVYEIDNPNEENSDLNIDLRDIKNWSEQSGKWDLGYENRNIRTKDALIMKNGKRIKASDLKSGDKLYIVADEIENEGFTAKVMVVK